MSTPGRNAPCPCDSGVKFKRCCGSPATLAAAWKNIDDEQRAIYQRQIDRGRPPSMSLLAAVGMATAVSG